MSKETKELSQEEHEAKIKAEQEKVALKDKCVFNFDRITKDPDKYYHWFEEEEDGTHKFTGFDRKKDLKVDDYFELEKDVWQIKKIEYRDHEGVFPNKDEKIGTFFSASVVKIA